MAADKEEKQFIFRRPGKGGPASRFAEIQYAENPFITLKRIWRYFTTERAMIFVLSIIVIIGAASIIYAPSLQSKAVDIIAGKFSGDLKYYIILMLIFYFISSFATLLQGIISAKLSQRIVKKMREEFFEKIIDLPISYLDCHSHGDVMSRMTNDIENISNTVSQSLPSLFSGVLTIIGISCVMLYYCWQLALISSITVIITVLTTKLISIKVRKYSRERSRLLGLLNGTVEEMISGYRTVVAYNHQKIANEEFAEISDDLTKAGIKSNIFSGIMGPVMNCIGNFAFVIIAAFGGYFANQGIITVGVISAFIVYARQFGRPVMELATVYGQLQTAIAGAERVFKILDEQNEDNNGEECHIDSMASLEFKNVDFSYVPGVQVIKDFSLSIPSGKKVALVGSTGCGKTTITNLLMRFYDNDNGSILVDGKDIKQLSRRSLRNNMAVVLQDSILFTDSIKNNLKYSNENATDDEINKALELSKCKEFVEALPAGCESILNGAGTNLSQGQKQLLCIARAFVADPKILIFDEATSNVDTRTEKAIQDAMHLVMSNRTSIVIAHRLSTIRDADIIIVMDKGSIVEKGNHDTLLAAKGKYYDLYMTQFAGFAT